MNYYNDKKDILKNVFNSEIKLDNNYIIIDDNKYEIINDVIILNPNSNDLIKKKTVSNFGDEWIAFNKIYKDHHKEFEKYFDIINIKILENSIIADFGCGMGRWSKILLEKIKPKYILMFDYSAAIFEARKNLIDHKNAIFIKGDIEKINFKSNIFDFSFCLGVLHHLPSGAEFALSKLSDCSKSLLLYLYYDFENRKSLFILIFKVSNIVRKLLSTINNPKLKNTLAYFITIFAYYPFIILNKLLRILKINYIKLPLSYYTDLEFNRIRQDAYDRFFTNVEYRYSRKKIRDMSSKHYNEIIISDNEPYWHFYLYNKK